MTTQPDFLVQIWGEDIDHPLTAVLPDWDSVRRFCVDYYVGSEDHADHYGKLTLETLKEEFDEHEARDTGEPYSEAWEIGGLRIERVCDCSPVRAALVADLTEAAATLRRYETSHRAKDTADSLAKAEVNAALASRFEATLAKFAA